MTMLKLPPNITSDRLPERRLHRPQPPCLGHWNFMVQTDSGKLRLEHTRRGVNLLWRRVPGTRLCATWHMHQMLNDYRGLRAVQRGQEIFESYHLLETDEPDVLFVCSMPRGIYVVTPRTDAEGEVLWWYDPSYVDDDQPITSQRKLEPELQGRVEVRARPVAREVNKAPIVKATMKRKPIVKAKLHP